jgi:hypothetical protein
VCAKDFCVKTVPVFREEPARFAWIIEILPYFGVKVWKQ